MQANHELVPFSGIQKRTYSRVQIKDGAWILGTVSGVQASGWGSSEWVPYPHRSVTRQFHVCTVGLRIRTQFSSITYNMLISAVQPQKVLPLGQERRNLYGRIPPAPESRQPKWDRCVWNQMLSLTSSWFQISHKVLLNISYLYKNSYDCEAFWLVLGDAVIGVPVRVVIDNMQLQWERWDELLSIRDSDLGNFSLLQETGIQ